MIEFLSSQNVSFCEKRPQNIPPLEEGPIHVNNVITPVSCRCLNNLSSGKLILFCFA